MTNRLNLVLGGGIAGLAATRKLAEKNQDYRLIEQNATNGGLTRSIYVDRFVFDYTGHFVHLAKVKHPDDLGLKKVGEWKNIERRSFCYVEDTFIDAPFQYNLGQLPGQLKEKCFASYLEAANKKDYSEKPRDDESLEDFLYRTFGEGITDVFLKPYNEKILATSISNISAVAINRFFPAPKKDAIVAGMSEKAKTAAGYNALFWYPKENGIQQLVDGMDAGFNRTQGRAEALDLKDRTLTAGKNTVKFDRMFSSVPLDEMLRIMAPTSPHFQETLSSLTYASVLVFQIGISGRVPKELADRHWIYVADKRLPFHRVGIYSCFNEAMSPKDSYSFYVEVGCANGSEYNLPAMESKVLEALDQLGWAPRQNIEVVVSHVIKHGYVHFNHAWQKTVPKTIELLQEQGIHMIGRYGTWNYISMEDGIVSSWNTVEKALENS